MPVSKRTPHDPEPRLSRGGPMPPKAAQKSLSTGFSPQRTRPLGAEAVDDMFVCPTVRADTRMALASCMPSCPESPWKAQHCPGSIPSVNAAAGEWSTRGSREKIRFNTTESLRAKGEYVTERNAAIGSPPPERLA